MRMRGPDIGELVQQVIEPLQKQIHIVHEVVEHEQRLQREVTDRLVAPFDAIFDLLEGTGAMVQRQAEALDAAGQALSEAAALMKLQADLFDTAVSTLRQPVKLVKATSRPRAAPKAPAAAPKAPSARKPR
jgi:hypothetical protein